MNDIEQAIEILKTSGLDFAINRKRSAQYDFEYVIPYWNARRCDMITNADEARKLVEEINNRLAPFQIGQGCAVRYYTDVHACRVIWTSADGKRVRVQEDSAKLLNGFESGEPDALKFYPGGFCGHTEGTQRYEFEANPEGTVHEFSLRVNGEWVAKGDSMQSPGKYLIKRHFHFHDYNF